MNAYRKMPFDLEDTGRVAASIDPEAAAILFGEINDATVENELNYMVDIDLAHLIMMMEAGLIGAEDAIALIRRISDLQGSGFAALQGVSASRGTFMLYESLLIFETGEKVGGMLQAGRSRNDMGATILRLRLRKELAVFAEGLIQLQKSLLAKALDGLEITLPAYTHYQAAQPTSLGHYLSGVAGALNRDLQAVFYLFDELDTCPLGAGAICGTSFPIRPERTAEFLGFRTTNSHSIETIASRDVILRLLAALSMIATTISRLCHDFQLWTTAEFGFFQMPDTMVGISSMMPQKRNVYILEHIKGMCSVPLGAFTSAAMAQHFTPFSNSIAVGTESVKPVWGAMDQLTNALKLMRLVVRSSEAMQENMSIRLERGQASATALAEWAVRRHQLPFRQVHHDVGRIVREVASGTDSLIAATRRLYPEWVAEEEPDLSPRAVLAALAYGAGPKPEISQLEITRLSDETDRLSNSLAEKTAFWRSANEKLHQHARELVS